MSEPVELPQLVQPEIRFQAADAEDRRIAYRSRPDVLNLEQLIAWLTELAGPRLLIVNTVQTAAAIARSLEREYGRDHVEHLSTALTPRDRARTLKRVKERLEDSSDIDWTLVATSCVEAGVDVSFRTGLRERASLTSLIQVGGRVNRSNEYGVADVWDFQLQIVGLVRENRDYQDSVQVLAQLFTEGKVAPDFCTEALSREIKGSGRAELNSNLRKAESGLDFPDVERLFRVINESTVTVVIDRHLQDRLEVGATIDWRQLQQSSVQIYSSKAIEFGVRDFLPYFPDLKGWRLDYDDFLGYMAGVLPLREAQLSAFIA